MRQFERASELLALDEGLTMSRRVVLGRQEAHERLEDLELNVDALTDDLLERFQYATDDRLVSRRESQKKSKERETGCASLTAGTAPAVINLWSADTASAITFALRVAEARKMGWYNTASGGSVSISLILH